MQIKERSSMKTLHFLRYDKENLLSSFFPIYHDSYSTSDLNIKYLELHTHFGLGRGEYIIEHQAGHSYIQVLHVSKILLLV